MNIAAYMVAGISVLTVITSMVYSFPLAEVVGSSMKPTLLDVDVILCCRFYKPTLGNIYVYDSPSGLRVVKRLFAVNDKKECFFIGDNREYSTDSREYGYVSQKAIVAEVIFHKKRGKNNEGTKNT